MKELLLLGAVDKPKFLVLLTSWVDKSSTQCMYTMSQKRTWSVPHLKACCWYIDCKKIICSDEEEDVKKAWNKAESKGVASGIDHGKEQDKEMEMDLSLPPEKEKNKIINQKTRDAKKATKKAKKEVQKAKDKVERKTKKGERSGKSKVVVALIPPFLLT
jgi:hypothetical protein